MTERTKNTLMNMIRVFNHIRSYQKSDIKICNKTETINDIMYQYDQFGCISSVYANCTEVNVFYNNEKQLREIMDYNGEFSLYVIYDEDNNVCRAFIANSFSRKAMPIIGNKEETIIQVNPFYPEYYIFDKNKNLIEVYKDTTDGLRHVSEENFNNIKETLDTKKYFD